MTPEAKSNKTKVEAEEKPKEINFKCCSCNRYESLEEMKIINRFFPPLVVCRKCEKEIR